MLILLSYFFPRSKTWWLKGKYVLKLKSNMCDKLTINMQKSILITPKEIHSLEEI